MKIVQVTISGGLKRWKLDWIESGIRVRRFFRTKPEAQTHLAAIVAASREVRSAWCKIDASELLELMAVYARARRLGVPVSDLLNGHDAPTQAVSCREAVQNLVEAKKSNGRRPEYVKSLRISLNKFIVGKEERPVSSITVQDVEQFLSRYADLSSRRSHLSRIKVLFGLAVRRGWAVRNPCTPIETPRVDRGKPEILTVRQSAKAMAWTLRHDPKHLAWLALSLFTGVRPKETEYLRWADIDLTEGLLTIDSHVSKVRQRRLVDLPEACQAWLRIASDLRSKLPVSRPSRILFKCRLADALGIRPMPRDILRHTAASMMIAVRQDMAAVALQLGDSPAVLFTHYRELVKRGDAERFFRLIPNTTRPWVNNRIKHG